MRTARLNTGRATPWFARVMRGVKPATAVVATRGLDLGGDSLVELVEKLEEAGVSQKLVPQGNSPRCRRQRRGAHRSRSIKLCDGLPVFPSCFATEKPAIRHRVPWRYSLPTPLDQQALAELGAQLAAEQFGIDVTPEEVLWLLRRAMEVCAPDYRDALDYAAAQIALDV